jgi:hypothetical protein
METILVFPTLGNAVREEEDKENNKHNDGDDDYLHSATSFSLKTHSPFNTARGVKQFDLFNSVLVFSLIMSLTKTIFVFVASLMSTIR